MKALFMFILSSFIFVNCTTPDINDQQLRKQAALLAQELIIIDGHVDIPYRLREKMEDISVQTTSGHFDYPRAKAGGLNAPFMSIYIPAEYQDKGGAKALADSLIDMVEGFEQKWPDKFAVARFSDDIYMHKVKKLISLPLGIENGAAIEGDLKNLEHFYKRGVRYITLTHSKYNKLSDSSYDSTRQWKGISPLGKEALHEMNRLGIMIDVSHISDKAFEQTIHLSKAPVIASHSSCRHFTPRWERNMNDSMLKKLAKKDGIIMINFGSAFITEQFNKYVVAAFDTLKNLGLKYSDEKGKNIFDNILQRNNVKDVEIGKVIDHIDHAVKIAGIDHVGLGSDFDGVYFIPKGLEDVSKYPNLIYHLLKRGYSKEDISKICSGNILRVWKKVEDTATAIQEG